MILVCKYRKKLLCKDIDTDIKQIIFDIEEKSDFNIIEMETDKDHIHIMIQYIPRLSISSIVNRVKAITTNRIWKLHFNSLKKRILEKENFLE